MFRRSHLAALLFPLILATPAFGQAADGPGSRQTALRQQSEMPDWVRDAP
jgi:hypothetical protein